MLVSAMAGGGTDTAIETADVALADDDLRKIPRFIRLSRSTYAILVQNISLALGVKALFFALTFTGNATMWMAVFADVGHGPSGVVANGLRGHAEITTCNSQYQGARLCLNAKLV